MSSFILLINILIRQLNIHVGLFIYISSIIGALLNLIIFTSLKTFRETPSGFYLAVSSLFNLAQTLSALTTRIFDAGFSVNLIQTSWPCKLRSFFAQSSVLLSLTSMSLVTIDQFVSSTNYHRWTSLRLARRHLLIALLVWSLHGITALIFWDTPRGICTSNSSIYRNYVSYFYLPVLLGCLPISVMSIFGLLSFYKIRTSLSRTMNMARLSRDRQLTAMVLSQVLLIVCASLPYTLFYIYQLNRAPTSEANSARYQLISTVFVLLYYAQFAVSDRSFRWNPSLE
jgi:hypothetical protein